MPRFTQHLSGEDTKCIKSMTHALVFRGQKAMAPRPHPTRPAFNLERYSAPSSAVDGSTNSLTLRAAWRWVVVELQWLNHPVINLFKW